MGLLQVVLITTLCIGCGLSGERCKIFKQGTNTPWPFTDMIVYMSPGDMFNATCGCKGHQIPSYWNVFDKDGVIKVDASTHTPNVCNTGTNTCIDIFQTITEPLIVLCSTIGTHDSTMQYSRPVVINIQEPDNNCTSNSPSPLPSQSPTYLSSSTTLSSLPSKSPSPSLSSLPPSSLFPLSSPPLMTSNIMTSSPLPSPLTNNSSCSNLTITVTTTFTTVIVTVTPTSSIHTEPITTTSSTAIISSTAIKSSTKTTSSAATTSSIYGDFITTISTSVNTIQAQVHDNSCTTTLLAVVVPIGCTVIAIVLLVTAILCIVVAVKNCPDRRTKMKLWLTKEVAD